MIEKSDQDLPQESRIQLIDSINRLKELIITVKIVDQEIKKVENKQKSIMQQKLKERTGTFYEKHSDENLANIRKIKDDTLKELNETAQLIASTSPNFANNCISCMDDLKKHIRLDMEEQYLKDEKIIKWEDWKFNVKAFSYLIGGFGSLVAVAYLLTAAGFEFKC